MYQPLFALLRLFELPESTEVLIEMDDDLDFIDVNGSKTLGSLKHKSEGDRLTDLSVDFWKSVRIWLARYKRDGCQLSQLRFFLFTTSEVSPKSFLQEFTSQSIRNDKTNSDLVGRAIQKLSQSTTELSKELRSELGLLSSEERDDFFSRITIFNSTPRISELPQQIMDRHMRSIQREFREAIFNTLEGWWNQQTILLLTGERGDPMAGYELSDKLAQLADEYKTNNLPIHFSSAIPNEDIDPGGDNRQFVIQLREIGVQSNRIRNAILDYYRAFSQRSAWVRESVLVEGEIEIYETRLVDEWSRYRDMLLEETDDITATQTLKDVGRELYKWAEFESKKLDSLRIREKVAEPYVVRGGFHILANAKPTPRVYWHPLFLERLNGVLEEAI